jgi:hypothetical protein
MTGHDPTTPPLPETVIERLAGVIREALPDGVSLGGHWPYQAAVRVMDVLADTVLPALSGDVQTVIGIVVGQRQQAEAELESAREVLAVQVMGRRAAEAAEQAAVDQVELERRLRRIAEGQLTGLDAEVRRLRELVPLEQRWPKTTTEGNGS